MRLPAEGMRPHHDPTFYPVVTDSGQALRYKDRYLLECPSDRQDKNFRMAGAEQTN